MYAKDINEVEIYVNKTSSHTFKSIAAYLAGKKSAMKIKCVTFKHTSVKSAEKFPYGILYFRFTKPNVRKMPFMNTAKILKDHSRGGGEN